MDECRVDKIRDTGGSACSLCEVFLSEIEGRDTRSDVSSISCHLERGPQSRLEVDRFKVEAVRRQGDRLAGNTVLDTACLERNTEVPIDGALSSKGPRRSVSYTHL